MNQSDKRRQRRRARGDYQARGREPIHGQLHRQSSPLAWDPAVARKLAGGEAQLVELNITEEPMPDPQLDRLPEPLRDRIERVAERVMFEEGDPRDAEAELLDLMRLCPEIPQLYNHLAVTYERLDRHEEATALMLDTFRRFPNYLFAKCNWAMQCLAKGRPEEVKEIFQNQFGLHQMYPGREVFHISEVVSLYGVLAIYLLRTGDFEGAERYLAILRELAPDHPMTKQAAKIVEAGVLVKLLERGMERWKQSAAKREARREARLRKSSAPPPEDGAG